MRSYIRPARRLSVQLLRCLHHTDARYEVGSNALALPLSHIARRFSDALAAPEASTGDLQDTL